VELLTALLFTGYFIAYFGYQVRACCPQPLVVGYTYDWQGIAQPVTQVQWVLSQAWPIFALYMATLAAILAASLIDAELYIIPLEIPWLLFSLGVIVHTVADRPTIPGALNLVGDYGPACAALSAGATLGLIISMTLWARGILPTSFADGEPMLQVDRDAMAQEIARAKKAGEIWEGGPLPPEYTPGQIRKEISKEMIFLLPPMICGGLILALFLWVPAVHRNWPGIVSAHHGLSGLLGSLLGALVGGFVVWITRILGTLVFRKVAMGLGDVHLMFGVGAVIGAAGATIAFFIAPFFGILWAIYLLIFRRGREIPYGPFLSMATAAVMLTYCPLLQRLEPGLQGLAFMIGQLF
jgi:leader peptidase (prepilin peptidase)/N-methyltransferase